MTEVRVREMTAEDETFVGRCAREAGPEDLDRSAARRVQWLKERHAEGVRAFVAHRDHHPVGFLFAIPIETSPWGPLGEDLLVIPCFFVTEPARRAGAAHALLEAVEEEARAQDRAGLVALAHNHEAWFMEPAFLEHLGFVVAARRGVERIYWKLVSEKTPPTPRILESTYRFESVHGKVVVDLFWNRFCLTSDLEAERVRDVASEFGERVLLREHDTTDPEVLRRVQVPRAIFVQGERISWGYEAPREGLRETILEALEQG
ncbi:MAG: N-acetyltransferase family protein [Planctomycetota bacterium]